MIEAFATYFDVMSTDDFIYYGSGTAAGAVIEISQHVDWTGGCWKQVTGVAENGFLAYYYFDQWQQFPDFAENLIYALLYGSATVTSMRAGGCVAVDVEVSDVIDFISNDD